VSAEDAAATGIAQPIFTQFGPGPSSSLKIAVLLGRLVGIYQTPLIKLRKPQCASIQ
jgi:hypothetical protein